MDKYVLLLRHGAVRRGYEGNCGRPAAVGASAWLGWTGAIPHERQGLSDEGRQQVIEVAERLAELLHELPPTEAIRIGTVYQGTYLHTKETARIVYDVLL